MDVYDREWLQHHSEEMLEMVKPNVAGEATASERLP